MAGDFLSRVLSKRVREQLRDAALNKVPRMPRPRTMEELRRGFTVWYPPALKLRRQHYNGDMLEVLRIRHDAGEGLSALEVKLLYGQLRPGRQSGADSHRRARWRPGKHSNPVREATDRARDVQIFVAIEYLTKKKGMKQTPAARLVAKRLEGIQEKGVLNAWKREASRHEDGTLIA